jgi:hypothetical protein
MLDYARQRAREVLSNLQTVVLATSGPAGVRVGEFTCEAHDLELFLLLPETSDHIFNLEHDLHVTLLTPKWEMQGVAEIISAESTDLHLPLFQDPNAKWCVIVKVKPQLIEIRRKSGWGNIETIDLKPDYKG